ncbi:hypothetical protein AMECASPLE_039414 [Ameca splendens]|uniref:Uncharacterized protein n=1 Tax=Ameca splendens TaxID=208324 RepID=A0ABV0ZI38_9TELE
MSSLPSAVSDANFPSPSLGLPGAIPSPSLGLPSAAAAPPSSSVPTPTSRVENSGPRTLPPPLGFSQSKDVPSGGTAPLTNGYSAMKTQESSTSSRTLKTESPVLTSEGGSGHHIPSPVVTPSHSAPISSLSSHLSSTHSSGSALVTSSSLTITNEQSSSSLHAFSSSSSQVVPPSAPTIASSSSSNGLYQPGGPGLTQNGTNTTISAGGSRTAAQITTTSGMVVLI